MPYFHRLGASEAEQCATQAWNVGRAPVVQDGIDEVAVCGAVSAYEDLLHVFFTIHDPTTLNRQGNDVGTQYRSAIFYHSPEQKATAEKVIAEMTGEQVWPNPIVTEVTEAPVFYKAEDYHQNYFENNPAQPYCYYVVAPKVAKLRSKFFNRLKKAYV